MHALVITAILMYIASRMTAGQLLGAKLAIFFLFLLPLAILLWRVGAIEVFADALWRVTMAFGELFLLFLSESYGWLIRRTN